MADAADAAVAHLQPRAEGGGELAATLWRAFRRSIALATVATLWETVPRTGLVEPAFLPPLSEVLGVGAGLLKNGQLVQHVRASLSRSLVGLSLAISLAVPVGLAIGWSRRTAEVFSPLLELARNTAPLALLPVFILLLGIGESSKVAFVTYACSWPILLNTIAAARSVDPTLVRAARVMGFSSLQLFRKVVLPASIPAIFVGVRLAGALSLLVLVAAEMIGATAGLGYLVIYSQYNFQIGQMYVGILTITLVGLTFNQLLVRLERRLTAWKPVAE